MADFRIGRNDPCPCGSGKKFKKCCVDNPEIIGLDPFSRISQNISSLKLKLDSALNSEIKRDRLKNKERFMRTAPDSHLNDNEESLYSDWMWFDARDNNQSTYCSRYLEENGQFLAPPLLQSLQALDRSYLSVYEPINSWDLHLEIRDIILDQTHIILLKEPWVETSDYKPLFLARLIELSEAALFSGMVLMLNNHAGEEELIRDHIVFLAKLNGSELSTFLKAHGELTFSLFKNAQKLSQPNLHHADYARITSHDKTALENHLNANSAWEYVYNCAGLTWYQPSDNYDDYARLAIGSDTVLCCAGYLNHIGSMHELIKHVIPNCEFLLLNNSFLSFKQAEFDYDLWFISMLDSEADKWLKQTNAEFNNHSALEVLNQADGLAKVQAVIEDTKRGLSQNEGLELIDYIRERITNQFNH